MALITFELKKGPNCILIHNCKNRSLKNISYDIELKLFEKTYMYLLSVLAVKSVMVEVGSLWI